MALDEQLDERKVKILKAVIKNYLETGEPVVQEQSLSLQT